MMPCPLCNSTNLSTNMWSLDHGEVDAIECNDCYCGAPVTAWQARAHDPEHDSGETPARRETPGIFADTDCGGVDE